MDEGLKYSWKVQGKLAKLMKLGFLVNSLTDRAVWVSFSGHVNKISFTVAISKDQYQVKIEQDETYLDSGDCKKLDKWIQILKKELANERIGVSQDTASLPRPNGV